MTPDRSYIQSNNETRQRLRALVDRLTDAALGHSLGEGWTVAAMLAHMAFWDYRALALVERWERQGTTDESPEEGEINNRAMLPLCLAIPPRAAADLALRAAEATDAKMAGLPADRLETARSFVNLWRSEHRGEHLEQLKQALGAAPPPT
jgi:hypothetical protein